MRRPKRYDVSVFLNCPFDDGYRPLLHAALFAIQDCGFIARTALEDVGSGETRLDQIVRIIDGSRYSIHDISRVEVSAGNPLPRFNLPFECGLSFGASAFNHPARAKGRDLLILAGEPFPCRTGSRWRCAGRRPPRRQRGRSSVAAWAHRADSARYE